MSGGKFDKPARKLHMRDVFKLENKGGCWLYVEDNLSFVVQLVWIQGTVVTFNQDKSEVTLQEDGTDLTIIKCNGIPGGNEWITQGLYVMVVGEIDANNFSTVNIRAIKMADLSDNYIHKLTWSHEVAELKGLLKENTVLCI